MPPKVEKRYKSSSLNKVPSKPGNILTQSLRPKKEHKLVSIEVKPKKTPKTDASNPHAQTLNATARQSQGKNYKKAGSSDIERTDSRKSGYNDLLEGSGPRKINNFGVTAKKQAKKGKFLTSRHQLAYKLMRRSRKMRAKQPAKLQCMSNNKLADKNENYPVQRSRPIKEWREENMKSSVGDWGQIKEAIDCNVQELKSYYQSSIDELQKKINVLGCSENEHKLKFIIEQKKCIGYEKQIQALKRKISDKDSQINGLEIAHGNIKAHQAALQTKIAEMECKMEGLLAKVAYFQEYRKEAEAQLSKHEEEKRDIKKNSEQVLLILRQECGLNNYHSIK